MKNQSQDKREHKKLLCLDARMYRHSGIGVYLLQLISRLKNDSNIDLILLVPQLNIPEFRGIRQIKFNAAIYTLKEQWLFPFRIPRCDIFWSPHYNVPLMPVKASERRVTIHDIYHLRFAHTLSFFQRWYARILMKAAVSLSDKIFTVSVFSKKEILDYFDVEEKIQVIPNVVETEKFSRFYPAESVKDVLTKYKIKTPYILFVGNIKPHKNLITLIKAFERIMKEITPVKLVIVGQKEGFITADNEVGHYMQTRPDLLSHICFTDQVLHDELPILYQQAELFVFPSLYEGFGYPPLEALAAGTKVLCSNAGPMPEVCGNRVTYFNPTDVQELASLIVETLASPE
jgi:glycosyltransferase involved in cell wall biosynthesis